MVYRKDIDGLRAVAVLSVILFHAGVPGFSGGFVGVDVFFVISGYLICGLLYEEAGRTGRISIAGFYERRARRILPALILVMAVSSLLAVFTLLPFQLIDFGTNALGVATFLSNVTLWLQGGYFSGPAEENPLLHTWSLAVEEQFYIAFPLMMALVLRLKRRALLLALILLASLASIAIAEVGTRLAPTANFFLLPGRFWELGLGAMAALSVRGAPWGRPRLAADAVSLAGLAMILASVLAFDAVTPFPSLWAMLPTFGALLVILMAGPETFAGRLLASPPFVAVGLISYSAYLWHQPLYAFVRTALPQWNTVPVMLALSLLALGLGWASWRFVERPFRNRAFLSRRTVFALSALALAALAGWGVVLREAGGFVDRYPAHVRPLFSLSLQQRGAYVAGAYNAQVADRPFASDAPKLLIIGDSYSQDFYNMLRETGAFAGFEISADYINRPCQIQRLGSAAERHIEAEHRRRCASPQAQINDETLARAREADVIVLAGAWLPWAAEAIGETLSVLGEGSRADIYVIGSKIIGPADLRVLATLSPAEQRAYRLPPAPETRAVNAILAERLSPDRFIDPLVLLCEAPQSCRLFTPEGALISYDGSHLTQEGAIWLGARLFTQTPLARYAPAR